MKPHRLLPSLAFTSALFFFATISALAQEAPPESSAPSISAGLLGLAQSTSHFAVSTREVKSGATGLPGGVVVAGFTSAEPYQGELEVVRRNGELLIVSKTLLPGFAVLHRGDRSVRTATYDDAPVGFDDLASDLRSVLNFPILAAAASAIEWELEATDQGHRATAQIPPTFLPSSTSKRDSGIMRGNGMSMTPKVLAIRAQLETSSDGSIASVTIEIDRTDPLAGMMRQFGGGEGSSKKDEVGTTRVITLTPSHAPPSKRSNRVRLELLAALAKPKPKGMSQPSADLTSKPRIRVPGTPSPSSAKQPQGPDVRARFQATIAKYDADGDGHLSKAEAADRWDRLSKYDLNQDDRVDVDELIAGFKSRPKPPADGG